MSEETTNLPAIVNTDPVNDMALAILDVRTPSDRVAEILNVIDFAKRAVKEADERITKAMIERVKLSGGEIAIGTVRYYLGHPPVTKCTNLALAIDEAFRACGGDVEKLAEAFGSNALKYGYCKTLLPQAVYAKCFTTTRGDKLETGEVKPPKLNKSDERFVK